jgi:hypothetical protein
MSNPGDGHGTEVKNATLSGFAIVGFIALIAGGIFLAIYAASYVPSALSRLASAVILSSDPAQNTETPVEEKPETVQAPEEEEKPAAETPATTGGPQVVTPPTTTRVTPTVTTVVQSGPRLYGLPDLALTSLEGGYMRGSTFIEDDRVPKNRDAAVRFVVRNVGTNVASDWRIRVDVEGEDTATGIGGLLYPGGSQAFTLRITDPKEGEEIGIDIEIDYNNRIAESNERNNDGDLELEIDD